MEISIESVIIALGYTGIFLMMVANGFISFPSSQILYILAGYLTSIHLFNFFLVAVVGALGNTLGNILLYEVARARGEKYLTSFRVFPSSEITKARLAFQKRGALFLAVGKLLPAIKVFAPIPAGIAKMNRIIYISIIIITSFIWAVIFCAIGYFFGRGAEIWGVYSIILFVITAFIIYYFYRYMNSESIVKEIRGNNILRPTNSEQIAPVEEKEV